MADEPKRRDLVSVSGWLYADVLLVIALIGFGSIFASKTTAPPRPTPTTVRSTTTTTTLAPNDRFQLHCGEFLIVRLDQTMTKELFAKRLREDTATAIEARGLNPSASKIGIIYVYGFGDITVGSGWARAFAREFFPGTPLEKVEKDFGGSKAVDVGTEKYRLRADNGGGKPEVVIKARLIYSGKQDSECR